MDVSTLLLPWHKERMLVLFNFSAKIKNFFNLMRQMSKIFPFGQLMPGSG